MDYMSILQIIIMENYYILIENYLFINFSAPIQSFLNKLQLTW